LDNKVFDVIDARLNHEYGNVNYSFFNGF